VLSNGREKIKLEEEAIGELMVADTDWESGAEVSDVEDEFEEEEEEHKEEEEEEEQQQQQQQQQASTEVKPHTATSGGLPTWGPPKGMNTNINLFVGPAQGVEKSGLHTSTKTARHCLC
jgi:hypothetical protein